MNKSFQVIMRQEGLKFSYGMQFIKNTFDHITDFSIKIERAIKQNTKVSDHTVRVCRQGTKGVA